MISSFQNHTAKPSLSSKSKTSSMDVVIRKDTFSEYKKPRKNRSAYMLFTMEIKAKLKADSTSRLGGTELQAKVSDLWKALPLEEKKKYEEQANEEKLQYMLKLKQFYEHASQDTLQEVTKPKPKRPFSGYCYFVKEIRQLIKLPDTKFRMQEILKQASEKWRMLSNEEKAVYHEKARLAKELLGSEASGSYDCRESVKSESYLKHSEPLNNFKNKSGDSKIRYEKKTGVRFSKEIQEKMARLEENWSLKKIKTNDELENNQNKIDLVLPKEKTINGEEQKLQVKQENPENDTNGSLMSLPMKSEFYSNWCNLDPIKLMQISYGFSTPQMNDIKVPILKQNLNIMRDLSLLARHEQLGQQILNQILIKQANESFLQQNLFNYDNNIQIRTGNI